MAAVIKVLGLALYGPLAASTRYRLGQYVAGLATQGIQLEVRYLLGNDYLARRFAGRVVRLLPLLESGLTRLKDLMHQARYDAAMLHCELLPLLPGRLERALLRVPYVYDFDDAFYLKYRGGRFGFLEPVLGAKFDRIMRGAAAITAGNQVLAAYASRHNAHTNHLPTVVDTTRYLPSRKDSGGPFTIGWIGSPSTANYLPQLVEPLSALGQEGPVRFVVIGANAPAVPHVEVVQRPWSEAEEVDLINSFDVGVMPLPDTPWAEGKCAFKLIQYMACARPVVASPVGANKDVVDADCGLLASTSQEWLEALRQLRDRPTLRAAMGDAARCRVELQYSLARNLPVLARILRQASMGD